MSAPTRRVPERRGLLLAFVVFGAFWGAWVAVLPDVREQPLMRDARPRQSTDVVPSRSRRSSSSNMPR